MLSQDQVREIRHILEVAKRPFIFFHDDPDGFASFLMFYRFVGNGKGYVVKAHPRVTQAHVAKVKEYGPDVVFVLDLAMVDQEFLDTVGVPVVWIDHHAPQQRHGVSYYNPRLVTGENVPTPALCYQVTQKDLWLATVGCVGDWYLPPFVKEFREEFPGLLPESITKVDDAYFDSPITPLVKALSFNLKGKSTEVTTSIKTMIKIDSPHEILRQETPRGKLIWKRYSQINKGYERMLSSAEKNVDPNDSLLVYTYVDDKLSLTKDLANEMIHRHPDKLLILGRVKSGEVKCSIRNPEHDLPKLLSFAFAGIRGMGGGHEHACGATIPEEDFHLFVQRAREWLAQQKVSSSEN